MPPRSGVNMLDAYLHPTVIVGRWSMFKGVGMPVQVCSMHARGLPVVSSFILHPCSKEVPIQH